MLALTVARSARLICVTERSYPDVAFGKVSNRRRMPKELYKKVLVSSIYVTTSVTPPNSHNPAEGSSTIVVTPVARTCSIGMHMGKPIPSA